MEVQRYDFAQMKATKTDEGYLVDFPIVGRIGIQTYLNADGSTRKEYRPADQVFNLDSLASFNGRPITYGHPSEGVNAKNYKKLTIGTIVSEGKQDGENVRAEIVIQDAEAIDKAEKGGIRELSLGYKVTMDETPGEYNGEKYDAIQTGITINHLALVTRARAGKSARLNLDAGDAHQITEVLMTDKLGRVRLDNGIEYDAAPEVAHALAKLRDDAADFATKATESQAKVDAITGERDTLKARVDGFQAEFDKVKADSMESARAEIKARAELEKAATSMKVDHAGKSDREVKEAVIKSVRADADLTGKSDEYVNAAFDMSVSFKSDSAMQSQRKQVNQKQDGAPNLSVNDKYKAYMAELSKGVK